MTTTREKKGFDCVKTTREIRDRLSVELAGMSPEDRAGGSIAGVSRTLSCAASSIGCGRRKVERASPVRCARPAAPCLDAIPSAARQEANDGDHGGLTEHREARKEDGVTTANSSHLLPRSQVVLALQVQPEARAVAEETAKPQRRVSGDRLASVQDVGDAAGRHAQVMCQSVGAQAASFELALEQSARMRNRIHFRNLSSGSYKLNYADSPSAAFAALFPPC